MKFSRPIAGIAMSLTLVFGAAACGDDEEEDPGVEVTETETEED